MQVINIKDIIQATGNQSLASRKTVAARSTCNIGFPVKDKQDFRVLTTFPKTIDQIQNQDNFQ